MGIEPLHLTPLQQGAAVFGSALLFASVLALIYRRKLRSDYGALWFTASAVILGLAVWQDGLRLIATALDAVTLTAPLFLLSILFLTVIAIHFSVRLSSQADRVTRLAQHIALLEAQQRGDNGDPSA